MISKVRLYFHNYFYIKCCLLSMPNIFSYYYVNRFLWNTEYSFNVKFVSSACVRKVSQKQTRLWFVWTMAAVAGTFIDGQISVQFLSNPQQKKKTNIHLRFSHLQWKFFSLEKVMITKWNIPPDNFLFNCLLLFKNLRNKMKNKPFSIHCHLKNKF